MLRIYKISKSVFCFISNEILNSQKVRLTTWNLLAITNILKLLLVALVTGLWLHWLWTRRNLYRFSYNFPGYFGVPIFGVLTRIRTPRHVFRVLSQMFNECKCNTICIWAGLYPVLVTSEPDVIQKVLSSPDLLNKAKTIYSAVEYVFMNGIITSPAKKWQHNRKVINPAFNHNVLISLLPIFHKIKGHGQLMFDSMVGTGENKLKDVLLRLSLETGFEATMGKVFNENDDNDLEFNKQFSSLIEYSVYLVLLSFLKLQGLFKFYSHLNRSKQILHRLAEELVVNKLQESIVNKKHNEKSHLEASEDNVLSIKKTPNIFVEQIIQIYQKQQLTWKDVIAESMSAIVASFETTANSMFSALVMLAMHADIQDKLYEELVSVFPEKNFQMEFEHMKHLPYLEMVLNETLRLAPPISLIGRHVVKDTQLTKDIRLPKDLQIIINIYHLHRRTDIWGPNAHKFNPDNFLPENLKEKHSYAFIPFSKGIRNCIGWRYGLFFLKVMLAGLVRNFRFSTTFKFEDLELVNHSSLKYVVEPGIEIHRR